MLFSGPSWSDQQWCPFVGKVWSTHLHIHLLTEMCYIIIHWVEFRNSKQRPTYPLPRSHCLKEIQEQQYSWLDAAKQKKPQNQKTKPKKTLWGEGNQTILWRGSEEKLKGRRTMRFDFLSLAGISPASQLPKAKSKIFVYLSCNLTELIY